MRRLLLVGVLTLSAVQVSCGYRWGTTYSDDVRTVSVPIFENDTFITGIEADLADAIVKEIQSATPWRVTSAENADTMLSGAIQGSRLRTLSTGPDTGLVQEQALVYTVDFEWRDNRSGELLVERTNFQAASTFIPARGDDSSPGERIELGSRAALEEMAQRIVGELRSSW
ncbi:MAG: LptE family protein [Planctomycetota bacterium]